MARATMKDEVRVTCYGETTTYKTRREAIKFYKEGMYNTEGAEQARYVNIMSQLEAGETDCSDECY